MYNMSNIYIIIAYNLSQLAVWDVSALSLLCYCVATCSLSLWNVWSNNGSSFHCKMSFV